MNLIVLIDKLLINLCIEYKYVLLLQLTEKKIAIFLSVGILEHSPLYVVPQVFCMCMMHNPSTCRHRPNCEKRWRLLSRLNALLHFFVLYLANGLWTLVGTFVKPNLSDAALMNKLPTDVCSQYQSSALEM